MSVMSILLVVSWVTTVAAVWWAWDAEGRVEEAQNALWREQDRRWDRSS